MKRILMGAIGLAALSGCAVEVGSGHEVSEPRQISSASALDVCCGFEVQVTEGDEPIAVVHGDDNLIDDIVTEVRGETLVIGWQDEHTAYMPKTPVVVEVVLPRVDSADISGGSQFTAEALSGAHIHLGLSGGSHATILSAVADEIDLDVSGGSQLDITEGAAASMSLELSGASNASVQGATADLLLDVSGASQFECGELLADDVAIDISGASSGSLVARGSIRGEVSGASSVRFSGEPDVSVDVSGASSFEAE